MNDAPLSSSGIRAQDAAIQQEIRTMIAHTERLLSTAQRMQQSQHQDQHLSLPAQVSVTDEASDEECRRVVSEPGQIGSIFQLESLIHEDDAEESTIEHRSAIRTTRDMTHDDFSDDDDEFSVTSNQQGMQDSDDDMEESLVRDFQTQFPRRISNRAINKAKAVALQTAMIVNLKLLGFQEPLANAALEAGVDEITHYDADCELAYVDIFISMIKMVSDAHSDATASSSAQVPDRWMDHSRTSNDETTLLPTLLSFKWPVFDMAQFEFGNARPGTCFDSVCVLTQLPKVSMDRTEEIMEILSCNLFTMIGDPIQVVIPSLGGTGRTKGHAFLEFDDPAMARACAVAVHGLTWGRGPYSRIQAALFRQYQVKSPTVRAQVATPADGIYSDRLETQAQSPLRFQYEQHDLNGSQSHLRMQDAVDGHRIINSMVVNDLDEVTSDSDGELNSSRCSSMSGEVEKLDSDWGSDEEDLVCPTPVLQQPPQRVFSIPPSLSRSDLEQSDLNSNVNRELSGEQARRNRSHRFFLSSGDEIDEAAASDDYGFTDEDEAQGEELFHMRRRRLAQGEHSFPRSAERLERFAESQPLPVPASYLPPLETRHLDQRPISIGLFGTSGDRRVNTSHPTANENATATSSDISEIEKPWRTYCEELSIRNRELQEQAAFARRRIVQLGHNNQKLHLLIDRVERDRDGLLFENDLLQTQLHGYEDEDRDQESLMNELALLRQRLNKRDPRGSVTHQHRQLNSDGLHKLSHDSRLIADSNLSFSRHQAFSSSMEDIRSDLQLQMTPDALNNQSIEDLRDWEQVLETSLALVRSTRDAKALEMQKKLDRQVEEQNELKLCVICLSNEKSILCLPCRHLCLCEACSSHQELDKCPICRLEIDEMLFVYA